MSQVITVVIREDPTRSGRAVEALRIALGLVSGDHQVTVALLDRASLLLAEDRDEVVDGDILEKYLPSLKQLETEFLVPIGTREHFELEDGFTVREVAMDELRRRMLTSDRVLVF